jgi:hypothetical protein
MATGLAMGAMLMAASAPALAQKVVKTTKGQAGSPHETVEWAIGGAKLTVVYGRPFVKGRAIEKVAPDGEAYRLGADEATTLTTDKNIMIGDLMVAPGSYTLFAIPTGKEWKLAISKQTGQWGTAYDAKQDLGRTALKVEKAAKPNEQFTISFEKDTFVAQWGDTKLTAAFMVH